MKRKVNFLILPIIILLSIPGSLFSGEGHFLHQDLPNKFNLSVNKNVHNQDSNKLVVTVKIDAKNGLKKVALFSGNKNTTLTPAVKNQLASIEFEINNSEVGFSSCPEMYLLSFKPVNKLK